MTARLSTIAAAPYLYPVPFACSAACGDPIRRGDSCVQTSPGLTPLERMHAVCFAQAGGRKPGAP